MSEELPRKRVTIYDVARAAEVAPSTVSRTFARPGRVNAQTAERIRRIADELGYRTTVIPRSERDEATLVLAFVVADVTNPVYAQMMRGFQNEARQAGFSTILVDSNEDSHYEQKLIHQVLPIVDGVALISSRLSDSAISQIAKVIPLVAVNRIVQGVPSVIPDTHRGIGQAVDHLHSLGHKNLTYLAGPAASWADGMRWRAIDDRCKSLKIALKRIGPNIPSVRGGLEASQVWRDNPTTSVIAFNDIMAIGFIKGAQSLGLRIPGDVSVIGVDNSMTSVLLTPALSTIAPPTGEVGKRAAKILIHQIRHRSNRESPTIVVPMTAIFRESVGRPSALFPSLDPLTQL